MEDNVGRGEALAQQFSIAQFALHITWADVPLNETIFDGPIIYRDVPIVID
jgi:hypothetical protein